VQPFSVLALQPFPAAVSPAALSQPFLRSHFLPYLICGDLLSSRFDCSHFISLQFFVQVVSNESFSAAAFAAFIFHSGFCAKFCSCFFTGKEDALSLQQFFLGENCRSCGIFLAASFNVVACPGAILIIACFLLLPFMSDKFKLG
jgi:hypothetical protein